MKNVVTIYNKIAEKYDKEFPDKNEHIIMFLNLLPKGSKILDVGCGVGGDVKFAASKGFKVVGIDASRNMVKIAKKNCPNAKLGVCDIKKIKFKPNSFDGIIAAFSLIHIHKKDVLKVIKKFHKILKNCGFIYIALQAGKSQEVYINEPLKPDEKLFFNIFSHREIEKILRDCDFSIINKFERKPKCKSEMNFNKLFIIAKKV